MFGYPPHDALMRQFQLSVSLYEDCSKSDDEFQDAEDIDVYAWVGQFARIK